MQIKVNRKELINAMELLGNIVAENKVRPVISQVLIDSKETCTLTGTNLEQTLKIGLDAEISEQGKCTISLEALQLLKLEEVEEIELIFSDNILKIGNAEYQTFDVDEYPAIRIVTGDGTEVEKNVLLKQIDKSAFAASQEEESVEVNCLRLDSDNFVSTDRFRMVVYNSEIALERDISLPLKSAYNLSKTLAKQRGEVINVVINDNNAVFSIDNLTYATRMIDLHFVDYKSVIASANRDKQVIFSKKEFMQIIKKALIVTKGNFENRNCAIFTFAENELVIKAVGTSKLTEKIDIDYCHETVKTSLNCKYILDFLQKIEGDLKLEFSNSSAAFIMTDTADDKYTYLSMPLAIRED